VNKNDFLKEDVVGDRNKVARFILEQHIEHGNVNDAADVFAVELKRNRVADFMRKFKKNGPITQKKVVTYSVARQG
jgi:hypothetical protein